MNRPMLREEKILDHLNTLFPGQAAISAQRAAKSIDKDARTLYSDPDFRCFTIGTRTYIALPDFAAYLIKKGT